MANITANKKHIRWHRKLGAYLLAADLVDEATLDRALEIQRKQVGPKTKIGKLLIEMGMTDDVDIAKTLASQLNINFSHVSNLKIPREVLSLIPASVAEASMIVPISKKDRKMVVAMANPLEQYVIDDLRFITQMDVDIAVAPESEVQQIVAENYMNGVDADFAEDIDTLLEVIEEERIDDDDVQNLIGLTEQAPVVKFTNHTLARAIKYKASDIHIEPRYSDTMIRYRIDGIMREILQASKKSHFSVIARIKIISNMDISIRRKPQDGRTRIRFGSKEYDLRISTIPTSYGEKATIRILDPDGAGLRLDDLGIPAKDIEPFKEIVRRPQGIILVTGPTGSGKSTTLYACLNELNTPEVNIITVEDPIEYDIAGINQVHINPRTGITFASGLRSILRQDPDIVMVGEIRDHETASIAFQASQTGHMVLSSLHTNDAPSAVTRLVDIGVEPYLVAGGLSCVIGQRLVRKLCENCKIPDPKTADLVKRYSAFFKTAVQPTFWTGRGCDTCHSIGYKGRMGLFEVLKIGRSMQDVLVSRESMLGVRKIAEQEGFEVLALDGLRKAQQGVTSHKELIRNVSLQSIDDLLDTSGQQDGA